MHAKLYFHNTLEKDLYPLTWESWKQALFDGSSGDLIHPDLGTIRARVLKGSVRLVAESRAGVTVEVTFTETVDDPDKINEFDNPNATASLQDAAAAADAA